MESKVWRGRASEETRPVAGGKTDKAITAKKSLVPKAGSVKPKRGGSINMDVEIHIAGPQLLERLASGKEVSLDFPPGPESSEFLITITEAKKDRIVKLEPLVDLANADVEIKAKTDDFGDWHEIDFEDKDGRGFGLVISSGQARALIPILTNFAQAREAWAKVQEGVITFGARGTELIA